jgi:hypothetical protein
MKKMIGITGLLILLIISVGVLPTFATPPVVVTRQAEGTYAVAECDGFDVLLDYSGEVTERFLSDQDGNLQLATYHLASRDRIYNSATGYEVGSTFVLNDRYDPDNELFYGQGVFNNITVPGYGLVRVHVGHFVTADYTTFIWEVGNGTHADQHDELLCEAMDRAP